ncbi:MAG: FAD-binding domain-containing protein, partial [Pseudomonadota bacterium]|nr:FAD-binding domain-containing protein [Pseudomonadota bacterium]
MIPLLQDFFAFEPTYAEVLRRLDAVHPGEYARTRNALDGAVTGLSPYLTHGVIGMRSAVARVLQKHRLSYDDKLMFEFAWREFFHHVWSRCDEQVLTGMRPEAVWSGTYASTVPADLREGRTGVPTIDAAVRQLYTTGYLHNHARMWLASYAVHLRKVHWRAGADWMYGHLLDGDVPSNHLSWQWVAATFSSKPYLFNADNVAKYAPGPGLQAWLGKGTVIDQDYEVLDRIARHEGDVGAEAGVHAGVVEPALWAAPQAAWVTECTKPLIASLLPQRREIELVTPWSMSEREVGSG